MMPSQLQEQAETALLKCLEEVPSLKVKPLRRSALTSASGPDLQFRAKLPEGERLLIVETKCSGQPKVAREACLQLRRYLENQPGAYGIFIAPYISPQAAAVCRAEGIGSVDLAGNGRLAFGTIYISREGNPNPFSQKRALRSLYSPKASRVLRVLLVRASQRQPWRLETLAREAQVSLGQVANVKKLLLDREWLESSPTGVVLTSPLALLEEWAQNYPFHRHVAHDFYTVNSPAGIEAELARLARQLHKPYALTGFSGAVRLAPAVRYQRVWAYLQGEVEPLAKKIDLKSVDSGANVTVLQPYDDGVFYGVQELDHTQVVSPVQLYLDLMHIHGRGEEAAAALLEQVIKPTWQRK